MSLSRTTRTLELSQLAELNARLREHRPGITASDLGLAGVPGNAILMRLWWDGPPEFPYVHAHFTPGDADRHRREGRAEPGTDRLVDLHTDALRELSHRLGLRQVWGA